MTKTSLLLGLLIAVSACGSDGGGDEPVCDLVGSWSGTVPTSSTFAGSSLSLDFAGAGAGHFRLGESASSPLQTDTTWEISGGELVVQDVERIGVFYGCDPEEVGRFRLHFSDDCGGMQLELVDDACNQRGDVLDGAQLGRAQ